MSTNSEFLSLYNRLDNLLRDKYNMDSRAFSCVKRYEDELKQSIHKSVRDRGFAIESIRTVRNTLIHEAKIYSFDAFNIAPEVISFLKEEIEIVSNPKKVIDVARPKDKIFVVTKNSKISEVIKYMSRNKISHVPVVDKNDQVIGVFSESTLYSYLINHSFLQINEDMKIGNILEYTYFENHISERFAFVSSREYVYDLKEDFVKKSKSEKRLVMIFITKNGLKNEPLLGLLTAIDLIF